MIIKRTLSTIIALAMTAGMAGAVPATAETVSSDNRATSVTSGNLTTDDNDTNNSKGDVNSDGKITDDDRELLNKWLTRSIGKNDLDLKNADVNLDGKVNILDLVELSRLCDTVKKTTSEQSIDEGSEALSAINTEDNAFKLSVDISAAGDAETLLSADESGYSNAIKSDMVVGVVPELEYEEGYAVDEVTLNFDIKNELTDDGKYASVSDDFKGVRKFNVFKYFEDIDMLLPIETNYDTESNTVTTTVDELGTYCLVDMEKWFETLGIKPEELATENTAPSSVNMMGTSKTTTLQSTSTNTASAPIDVVFHPYAKIGEKQEKVEAAIKVTATELFKEYGTEGNVRIYVVDYDGKLPELTNGNYYAKNEDELQALLDQVKGTSKNNYEFSYKTNYRNLMGNCNNLLRVNADRYYVYIENSIPDYSTDDLKYITDDLVTKTMTAIIISNSFEFEDMKERTGGMIKDELTTTYNFGEKTAKFIIENHGSGKNDYITLVPTGWKQISLEKPITNEYKTVLDDNTQADKYDFTDRERFADTDKDGLIDLREIRYSFNGEDVITWDSDGKVILPTIKDCLKLKSGKKYLENVLSQYKFVDWDDFDRFINIRILPINSDPTSEDSDKDGVNEEDDALPFHYNDSVSYIFVPDDVDEDETLKYVLRGYKYKLCNETKDIVKVVICKNTQDFENYWNNMDLTQEGKIIYKINQVHLLGHGDPHCLDISGQGSLHGSLFDDDFSLDNGDISIGGLQLKEIELLNTIGCNCGNLDFNSDNNGDGFYGDNLAISFLKNDYKIKKVTAWDGYAYIYGETIFSQISDAYCAKMIDDMKSTAFNSKKTEESDFQKWSKDVNGFKRESEGLITYYRADDGSIIANPSEKHYID